MLRENVKSLSVFCAAVCTCLVVPRKILSAARNQMGLVGY